LWQECAAILEADGELATQLPSYEPRQQQLTMAHAVCQAIENQQCLVVEAGTGVGKTFAYLVPIVISRNKTIIATGTKNLQDQLFNRDLPFIQKLLKIPVKTALLKGRANYLCRYRIQHNQAADSINSQLSKAFAKITHQLPSLKTGEISEIEGVSEDHKIWPLVTSTIDNCLNQECGFYNDCFLVKARRKAQNADVIVINHHLYFANSILEQNDTAELLPRPEVVVFDEAHQLPDIASHFFGKQISLRQIITYFNDLKIEWQLAASDQIQLPDVLSRIEKSLLDMQKILSQVGIRHTWNLVDTHDQLVVLRRHLDEEFEFLLSLLEQLSDRSKGLQLCLERGQRLIHLFLELTHTNELSSVHWYEVYQSGFSIYFTPLDIAQQCQNLYKKNQQSWIFTSATLSINKQVAHFAKAIGVEDAVQICLSSPFDYQRQALLYVPRYLGHPNSSQYIKKLLEAVLPIMEILKGRTMFLFTSHIALNQAFHLLESMTQLQLLAQGSIAKDQLIQAFISQPKSVLLATQSFWEGVDIKGDGLSCVIIDKLPFMHLDNPVLQARMADMRRRGLNPFNEYQLPMAATSLQQGAGRLIRDGKDQGILIIGDPRLVHRNYGPWLVANLPPMRRTRNLSTVKQMLEKIN